MSPATYRSGDHVAVVGAGIAGLATAVQLSRQGIAVTVCEKETHAGGKIRQAITPVGPVDLGPTVCTMPWVFDELLQPSEGKLAARLQAEPLDVLAHHRWADGTRLNLYADPVRSCDAVAECFGPKEAQRLKHFQHVSRQLHDALLDSFLKSRQPSLTALIRRTGAGGLLALGQAWPFASLWGRLGQLFGDPHLRQLFARYATYCGSSPMNAPSTLMLIAHVEQAGVWRIPGGMARLARALTRVAEKQGVRFIFGRQIAAIDMAGGRVSGVRWENGEILEAAHVVVNADIRALSRGLLGGPGMTAIPPGKLNERSLSAITWAGLARLGGNSIDHHNVFFSSDYPAEFEALFGGQTMPEHPTVYLCASDRPAAVAAPGGNKERIMLLINAPASGDRTDLNWALMARKAGEKVRDHLRACGVDVEWDPAELQTTTPADFHRLYPGTGGALYGEATHGWRSAFTRPGVVTKIPGLYLAGGSVHPGPGMPMAAISGMAAAAQITAAFEARARSNRAGLARA